jgi:hypothetical protein
MMTAISDQERLTEGLTLSQKHKFVIFFVQFFQVHKPSFRYIRYRYDSLNRLSCDSVAHI